MKNKEPKKYKLTSVEVEENLLAQVKAKLSEEKMTLRKLVENAMKRYLRK